MNTFYFDDRTEQIVIVKPNNGYTKITTNKDYNTFCEEYENCRQKGNSILDSIEWAE